MLTACIARRDSEQAHRCCEDNSWHFETQKKGNVVSSGTEHRNMGVLA